MFWKRTAHTWVIVTIGLVAVGCSRDPEASKREYLELGDKYTAEQKYSEAALAYRKALEQDDRFGEARHRLGKVYLRLDNPKASLEQLVRAADLLPNDPRVQLDAARILLVARRYEDARDRADAVLAYDADNIEAHIMRAMATAGLRDFDGADAGVRHAIQLDPNRGATYIELASLQSIQGKTAAAEEALNRALALDPRSVEGHLALANLYWSTNRRSEAERSIKTALEIDPSNVIANRALANVYLATNRRAEAEAPLRKIVETVADTDVKLELAQYYINQNRPGDARKLLDEVASGPEGFARATTASAEIEYNAARIQEAHALVDSVLAKHPTYPRALVLKGRWLLNEQKTDDALARAEAAVAAEPEFADAHFLLGSVYLKRGERNKALAAFREVLRINPQAVHAETAISTIALQAGNRDEALKFAEEAVKSDSTDGVTRLVLGTIPACQRARGPRSHGTAEHHAARGKGPSRARPDGTHPNRSKGLGRRAAVVRARPGAGFSFY